MNIFRRFQTHIFWSCYLLILIVAVAWAISVIDKAQEAIRP